MARIALLAAALLLAGTAAAEPAKHNCTAPEHPGRMASDNQQKVFNKKNKEYGDCMKKYIADQQAVIQAATDAANAAINEFNDYAKKINALAEE